MYGGTKEKPARELKTAFARHMRADPAVSLRRARYVEDKKLEPGGGPKIPKPRIVAAPKAPKKRAPREQPAVKSVAGPAANLAWIAYVKEVQASMPGLTYGEAMAEASALRRASLAMGGPDPLTLHRGRAR